MYGPPGTGKTLMARACAAQTKSTFLKLAGPQLVQMFIGDGAKLVRDAFALAKEKAPAIIFIDELDAIGTKRFDSEKAGDREVQRTMLELLNQLDGFSSTADIKVCTLEYQIIVYTRYMVFQVIFHYPRPYLIPFFRGYLEVEIRNTTQNDRWNLKIDILKM